VPLYFGVPEEDAGQSPCNVTLFGRYFNTYTVNLLLFRTLTNKCTIISQIITLLHVSTLLCHPQAACNQYLAKLHKYFKCSLRKTQVKHLNCKLYYGQLR